MMEMRPDCERHLDAANQLFHDTYEATRDVARQQAPVLILLQNELVLHENGERRSFPFQSPSFEPAKAGAHIAVALFTLSLEARWDDGHARRFTALLEHARTARAALDLRAGDVLGGELSALLSLSVQFAEQLARTRADACTGLDPRAFARDAGQHISRLTELATAEQLEALHEAVNQALRPLSVSERDRLEVVVLGDHQARARSMGMQYFQRRLGEAPGADERVTFGEHLTRETEALALVGTRRLDRELARAFFGDEKRLQRDVLADAATACLDRMQVAPEREH